MIVQTLKKALTENPHVIFPYGKIEHKELKNGLQKVDYKFPKELVNFWEEFGGGEVFEVETFLYPLESDNELIDNLWSSNDFYYQQGLDKRYIVFQKNAAQLTVFDKKNDEIVLISNEDYIVRKKFDNFNQWFLYFWQIHQA